MQEKLNVFFKTKSNIYAFPIFPLNLSTYQLIYYLVHSTKNVIATEQMIKTFLLKKGFIESVSI